MLTGFKSAGCFEVVLVGRARGFKSVVRGRYCCCVGSVVISPAHHLLASGSEEDGVFELSGVAALGVTERRVRVHDAQVTQVLQGHQVLAFTEAVQPASAEGQRAKFLVNHIQQVLSSGQPGGGGGGSDSGV